MYHTKLLTTDCACQQTPYPCIGLFRFLELDLHRMSIYPEILERVRTGDKFLDLGCALGQELRHLVSIHTNPKANSPPPAGNIQLTNRQVHDGAPSTNLYGCDLNPDLINVGYDLFNDQATLQSQFIVSDIFNYKSDLITRFTGHFDIINAMSFFHLFTWDQQILVAKCIITLLRPQPGSLLVGRQVGKVKHSEGPEAGESLIGYFHNEESWREMWEVVARETGTRWRVDVVEEKWGETASEEILRLVREQGQIKVRFVVRRE